MKVVMLVLNDMTADARVEREARTLAEVGHEVIVLALRSQGLPEEERRDGYVVRRVARFSSAGIDRPVRKLLERRERTRMLAAEAASTRPDVVHAHDTDTLQAAFLAAKGADAPVVYDAHELYPDSLAQLRFRGSAPVQAYWRRLEKRLIPRVDAVITVTDGLADVLHRRFGVDARVVANAPALTPAADRTRLRRELRIPDDRVVMLYQGGIYAGRATDPLLDAVDSLHQAVLVVQGTGEGEGRMRDRVSAMGLHERVLFMGQVAQSELFDYTCGADVGTVFLDAVTLNHQLAWPNRLFMYMMAGIPVAVTATEGMTPIVEEGELGLTAPPGDVKAMIEILRRLADDPSLRAVLGRNGRRLAETRWNWEHESRELLTVYESLEAERGA